MSTSSEGQKNRPEDMVSSNMKKTSDFQKFIQTILSIAE